MNASVNNYLRIRLQLIWDTIPSSARRRCARGLMRTCRALTDCLDRARQLLSYAETPVDREAIDELVAEIERRRDELSDNGQLARTVHHDKVTRANRHRYPRIAFPKKSRLQQSRACDPSDLYQLVETDRLRF